MLLQSCAPEGLSSKHLWALIRGERNLPKVNHSGHAIYEEVLYRF
jgi:hypothetical protein